MTQIEKKLGEKIKKLRKGWGMSQIELAEKVGLSFQQIQKYEKGVTKVSVQRLQQISDALGVHITYFFEKKDRKSKLSSPKIAYGEHENVREPNQFLDKEEITFLKLFRKIENRKIKEGLLKQLKGIVELEKNKSA